MTGHGRSTLEPSGVITSLGSKAAENVNVDEWNGGHGAVDALPCCLLCRSGGRSGKRAACLMELWTIHRWLLMSCFFGCDAGWQRGFCWSGH